MHTYVYFLSIVFCTAVSNIDIVKLKINAQKKLSILIPSINLSASKITIAFITNKNKPRVIKVIGNVSTTKIGFTILSNNDKINANIKAVIILSICTPDNIFDNTKAMIAEKIVLVMNFIMLELIYG
jgi:hypothetical protein